MFVTAVTTFVFAVERVDRQFRMTSGDRLVGVYNHAEVVAATCLSLHEAEAPKQTRWIYKHEHVCRVD
jgi:hypothetical protein